MATKNKRPEWDANKTYTFELINTAVRHKGKYVLPSESVVFDDGVYRKVRLSTTATSPFVDEQDDTTKVSPMPIVFIKGVLHVSGRDRYKLDYLMALDHNIENNSRAQIKPLFKYKLVNKEANEKSKAEIIKLKLKVQNILAEASKQDLADYLFAEYNYTPQTDSIDELFNLVASYAEVDPKHVLDTFQTEASKLKARLAFAFKKDVLKNTKGVITWSDTGTEIVVLKPKEGEQITDLMVDWISKNSKEALDFVKKLATKMTV